MKVNKLTQEIFCIMADIEIRYWNDSKVNGKEDINFYETKGEGYPIMPCATQVREKPTSSIYSDHWRWRPLINIEKGQVVNWQQGNTANVFYKVCDDFACRFIGHLDEAILDYEGYVPDFMCPGDTPDGDYIIMDIDENGYIKDWDVNRVKKFVEYQLIIGEKYSVL